MLHVASGFAVSTRLVYNQPPHFISCCICLINHKLCIACYFFQLLIHQLLASRILMNTTSAGAFIPFTTVRTLVNESFNNFTYIKLYPVNWLFTGCTPDNSTASSFHSRSITQLPPCRHELWKAISFNFGLRRSFSLYHDSTATQSLLDTAAPHCSLPARTSWSQTKSPPSLQTTLQDNLPRSTSKHSSQQN